MLSASLADQKAIQEFVADKTDREVAVIALTSIDQHVRECSDRWNSIKNMLRWLGVGIGCIFLERVANDVHWDGLSTFLKILLGIH